MNSVPLNLSNAQMAKLRNQKAVQINPSQVGSGQNVVLDSVNYKKLVKAYNAGKSVRITLTGHEAQMSGGSLKSVARAIKKPFKDPNLGRKISNTSRKIKNTVNKFEVVGDLGIPYVSDAYNAIHAGVNSGDALVQSGVELNNARLYGDAEDKQRALQGFNTTMMKNFAGLNNANSNSNLNGQGVNPYIPRKGGAYRTAGGSFRSSGSKGGAYRGSSYKTGGSIGMRPAVMRPSGDETNILRPNHPSFNPPKPDSYSGSGMKHTCPHCGNSRKKITLR